MLWVGLVVYGFPLATGYGQYQEAFEGPDTSWQLADRDCTVRIIEHTRSFERSHSDQASEYIQFRADHGTFVHLAHAIPPSRLIDELNVSVWIRSNRPGLQLMIRVVLPRSTDPRTGGPLKTLIRGDSYQQVDGWAKLSVGQPVQRLTKLVPLLRSQFGPDVDAREAYADLIVLNAYGGRGTSDVWIDDLEVSGQVSVDIAFRTTSLDGASPGKVEPSSFDRTETRGGVELVGGQLLLDGRSRLPRVIEHNGEPLSWLKSLGFNAVRLSEPPSSEFVEEAEAAGFWIIAPPPIPSGPDRLPDQDDSSWSRVLAWDLGHDLGSSGYESVQRAARQLRGSQHQRHPVLICSPSTEISQYSRLADLLLLKPPRTAGSLQLEDLGDWYLQRSRLARQGTPFWASVDTQISPRVMQQMRAFGADVQGPLNLEPEQMRLSAFHAVASGAQGVLFRSASPLNQTDRLSMIRARSLQRLNQELELIEPWATTSTHESEIETADPTLRLSVLKMDRSRLVLVIQRHVNQQFVAGPSEKRTVSFVVHGVSETDEIYRIAADGLHRVRQQRGTGMRITLDTSETVTAVVLTQDRLVINYLARKLTENRSQNDRLAAEIAAYFYASVVDTHQQLLKLEPAAGSANDSLEQARAQLQHYEQLIEGGGHEQAHKFLTRGLQQLASTRYEAWQQAVAPFSSPVASPLCVSFFSLPYHYALVERLRGARWGPNSLAGGDFESLSHLQTNQWQNVRHDAVANSAVELSLHAPRNGRSSLRLQCWPNDPQRPALVVDAPPISIITGPVPVTAGQIVRIHGWARVPDPIRGSLDGLLIYDSLAGSDLAHRIHKTDGWQEFTLYRAAVQNGTMTITFSLSGFGEAWLDQITVTALGTSVGPVAQRRRFSVPVRGR